MKSGVYINNDEGDILYLFGGAILVSRGNLHIEEYDADLKALTLQPFENDGTHEVGETLSPDCEGAKPKVFLGFHNNGEIDNLIGLLENLKEISNDKVQQK